MEKIKMGLIRQWLADSVARFHLEKLYKMFSYLGLGGWWYRIAYRDQMKKDVSFFSTYDVKKRIDKILCELEDEESRITYKKSIKFRQKHYGIDRPCLTHPQYFIPEVTTARDSEEVFVDGGGYIGDTYDDFKKWSYNQFKKYIVFEPSIINLEKFRRRVTDERMCYRNEGLWSNRATLYFSGGISGGEIVSENKPEDSTRAVSIDVTSIDSVPECKEATFIKMDIEGSEMKALEGAICTIRRNRPKLAICIYHSNEDMLRIPEWCFKNLKNYRFYVRHHHYLPCDTVFYAVPNKQEKISNENYIK